MESLTSGSVKFAWMSLDRPTRSIRLIERLKFVSGTNVDLHMRRTNVYLASFGRKFIKIAFWFDSDFWLTHAQQTIFYLI